MNKLISFLVGAGVHGLFFLGNTGEFQYLSTEQKKQVISIATRADTGKVKIFVGTTGETIEEAIELTRYARQKSVDAVVINPRYKTSLSTYDYLRRVLDSSHGPVILYNNPAITEGKNIEIEDLQRLFEIPKYKKMIVGIKDSSADPRYFGQLLELRNRNHPQMAVFQGSERALVDMPPAKEYHIRIDGVVSGSANFDPKLLVFIYNSIKDGYHPALGRLLGYIEDYDKDRNAIAMIKKRLAFGFKIPRSLPGSRVDLGYDEITPKIIASAELAPRKAA